MGHSKSLVETYGKRHQQKRRSLREGCLAWGTSLVMGSLGISGLTYTTLQVLGPKHSTTTVMEEAFSCVRVDPSPQRIECRPQAEDRPEETLKQTLPTLIIFGMTLALGAFWAPRLEEALDERRVKQKIPRI